MRKYIFGIVIAIIFLAYSTVLRHQHSRPVIAPASLSQNNSSSSNSSNTTGSTTTTNTTPSSQYKDGTYTGSVASAYYGNVQVQAVISNGKITTSELPTIP